MYLLGGPQRFVQNCSQNRCGPPRKAQGIKLGRPKGPGKSKLDKFRPEIEALLANGSTQKFIANRYGTTEANLHNWMKKNGIKKVNPMGILP